MSGGRAPRIPASALADALLALALAMAAVGAALLVWRPAPRVPELRPSVPPPPAPARAAPASADAALEAAVVRGNLFSPARTPPRVRYLPPDAGGVGGAPEPFAEPTPGSPAEPPPPRGPDDAPQFYGTVIGPPPEGARALLRLDGRAPGARLYAEGEGAAGWRVVRVEPERVVLAGAGGRVTLRLPQPGARARADSAAPRAVPATPDSLDPPRPT